MIVKHKIAIFIPDILLYPNEVFELIILKILQIPKYVNGLS